MSDSEEGKYDDDQEILSNQMNEIIQNLIKPQDKKIRNDKDISHQIQRKNNSLEEPEFFKLLE